MFKKILFYLFSFYTLLGFVVIPLVLKPQVINIIMQETNAKIEIDSLYFNPYRFMLSVKGLKLSSLEDKELVFIKYIEVNIDVLSLFNSAIHVRSFILEEPRISLVLDKNKNINLASILKDKKEVKEEVDTQETTIPRIIINRIAIIDGSLNYEDYSNTSKFEFALDSIGFELRDIDTKNINENDAKLRFYMKLGDGGFLDLKSEIITIEPLRVKGTLDYEASKLYTQWRYVKDKLHLEVADGKVSLHTEYAFNLDDLESTTLSNLTMNLDNLRVKPKDGKSDVLTLKSLSIINATIKPLAQSVKIESIALKSLDIKAKRDENALIDWLAYIKVEQEKTQKVKELKETKVKPWDVLVKEISLEDISFNFQDLAITPNVTTSLDSLNIYAQNITLAGKEEIFYQMNLQVNDTFKCELDGSVIHSVLDLETKVTCSGFDVEHYVPYIDEIAKKELKIYDVKLRSLLAGFDANIRLRDINSTIIAEVKDANIVLDTFAMNQESTNKRIVTFKSFKVNGINVNTQTKEILIKDTRLSYLHLRTARLEDGSMSLENLVVPKKTTSSKKAPSKEKSFRLQVKNIDVHGAKVTFEDKALTPSVKAKIDRIYLTLKNIDSKKNSWFNYYMSSRVNETGKIKSSGAVRHTPLKQRGTVELERISLKELTPYIQEKAHLNLDDGYVSLKTKTSYSVSETEPDLNVEGSFKLEEIFVNDSRDNVALVSFSKIDLKEFTLETSPNRLYINEVDINAFYVNAMIDSNKSINFSKLMKDVNVTKTSEDILAEIQIAKEEEGVKAEPFPIRITKVNVKNGSASFEDASLPIHFKTNIHDLNGEIYSLSTSPEETSYIDLAGDIDEYGSTKLKGGVKSADPKVYTDIDFNFRNLDLSSMTGYSATFAGYEIDEGRLFLSLNYDIKDSKLLGENSIIVKNIKLGREVDIEGGSLPLGFVIALLEDSDGIIDIDMPIRGNVDEPDFKYGALAWKTFGNLVLKAVTSPFRFLGSMLGFDGEELEYVEFEGGSSLILPSEREKLDNISKMMIKRPKISLSIGGGYHQTLDREVLQKEKLIALVVKRSGAKNKKEKINVMTIELLENIYKDVKNEKALEELKIKLKKKYTNKEEFKSEYLLGLIELCKEIQEISLKEIQSLAIKRTDVLKEYLVDVKGVEIHRIKVLEIIESKSQKNELIQTKLEVVVE